MRKRIWALTLALHLTFLTAGGMYMSEGIYETIGTVADVNGSLLHVVGESFISASPSDIVIDTKNARVYDLLTGFPMDAYHIAKDQSVRVAYDASHMALAVWLNYDDAHAAVFSVAVSDNIQYGADNCTFLCTDGKYRVTLSSKTVIIDPYAGEMSPSDILPGQEFFVWVDMITASSPSLVYPEKVVLIDD